MSFFSVQNLTAGYGGHEVIRGISFSVNRGEILGILGANGCGKSTLLKSICGILPHGGTCALDGTRLEGLSPRRMAQLCAYIPQRSGIGIDISALDVVLMAFNPHLGLLSRPTADMRRRAAGALETVGLSDKADENFQTFSEGQKQLCILARTLASDARLLLLDEPESALDFRYRYRMFTHLRRRAAEGGCCAAVLHDPQLALNCCDRILLIENGRAAGMIRPEFDALSVTEQTLSRVYGSVCLRRCTDAAGGEQLVMIRNTEDAAL